MYNTLLQQSLCCISLVPPIFFTPLVDMLLLCKLFIYFLLICKRMFFFFDRISICRIIMALKHFSRLIYKIRSSVYFIQNIYIMYICLQCIHVYLFDHIVKLVGGMVQIHEFTYKVLRHNNRDIQQQQIFSLGTIFIVVKSTIEVIPIS